MTFPIINASGMIPTSKDLLISKLIGLLIESFVALMKWQLILSCPVLFFGLREIMVSNISFGSVGERLYRIG